MHSKWFSHLKTADEKSKFKENIIGSQKVLDKLRDMCYNSIKNGKSSDYDNPSWAYKQADQNGYNRALEEIISLLDFSDKEQKETHR